ARVSRRRRAARDARARRSRRAGRPLLVRADPTGSAARLHPATRHPTIPRSDRMSFHRTSSKAAAAFAALCAAAALGTSAGALTVSRLTPPSQLFATGGASATPMIARFAVGQRFDLQATVQPDAGQTISAVSFLVDGLPVGGTVTLAPATV